MKVLVDSDVVIDALRGEARILAPLRVAMKRHRAACSAITVLEVQAELRKGEEQATELLLSAMRVAPVSREIAALAGGYVRVYGPSHGVEGPDAIIGATAVLGGYSLWTGNRRHYPIPRLKFWRHGETPE